MVVLAGDGDLAQIARSAPAAAVIVSGDAVEQRCQATYDATLFPRGRIVGVPDAGDVVGIVESIVLERDDAHEVVAMTDGQFGRCSAKLGRGGIREFIAPRTSVSAS